MKRNELGACKSLLKKLTTHKYAWPFLEPVDPVALGIPDYFKIIKNPMDFQTIQNKRIHGYKSLQDFADDVRLVFKNCFTYNQEGSDIFVMCENLQAFFEQEISLLIDDEVVPTPKSNTSMTTRKTKLEPPHKPELIDEEDLIQDLLAQEDRMGTDTEDEEEVEPVAAAPPKVHNHNALSPYEIKRLENIRQNEELLKSLQLGALFASVKKPKPTTPSRPKKKIVPHSGERRLSKRKKGLESPLFDAVRDKNLDKVKELLALPETDVNYTNGMHDETALHFACAIGEKDIVVELLKRENIDVNAKDSRNSTPIDIAIQYGFDEIKELLLAKGAVATVNEFKARKEERRRDITSPSSDPTGARCTCCHYCRTSLTIRSREYKGCSTCPYIICANCSPKLGLTWEELKAKEWVCEVCTGDCVCSRCISRGPPKWFGHQNPLWKNPETLDQEREKYEKKVKEAIRNRNNPK